ncbi:MAG TPA: hypothetical protein VGM56_28315 [Byssovorax sp.]|jgi:sugar lactone lactonase YvrE
MTVSKGWYVVGVVGVFGCAAACAAGCGGDTTSVAATEGEGGSGATSSTTGHPAGTGGHNPQGGTGGHNPAGTGGSTPTGPIASATAINSAFAFDATLTDDGAIVFYTGLTATGGAVFSMPVGGGTVSTVAESANVVAPFGIALSVDQHTVYVADPGFAEDATNDSGTIWSVSAEGGNFTEVMGGANLVARSLDVVADGANDAIYFSGSKNGTPGVFKLESGAVTTISQSNQFHDPGGVAVASDGTVYVIDTTAGSYRDATVFSISGTTVAIVKDHLWVGYPAGLALSQDEKTLIASGTRDVGQHAVAIQIDITSSELTYFPADTATSSPFLALFESGGLHRARNKENFAWVVADTTGGGIFLLK